MPRTELVGPSSQRSDAQSWKDLHRRCVEQLTCLLLMTAFCTMLDEWLVGHWFDITFVLLGLCQFSSTRKAVNRRTSQGWPKIATINKHHNRALCTMKRPGIQEKVDNYFSITHSYRYHNIDAMCTGKSMSCLSKKSRSRAMCNASSLDPANF